MPTALFDLTDKSTDTTYKKLHYFEERWRSGHGMDAPSARTQPGDLESWDARGNRPRGKWTATHAVLHQVSHANSCGTRRKRRKSVAASRRHRQQCETFRRDSRANHYFEINTPTHLPVLEIDTHLVNHCECHRLRVFFPDLP